MTRSSSERCSSSSLCKRGAGASCAGDIPPQAASRDTRMAVGNRIVREWQVSPSTPNWIRYRAGLLHPTFVMETQLSITPISLGKKLVARRGALWRTPRFILRLGCWGPLRFRAGTASSGLVVLLVTEDLV